MITPEEVKSKTPERFWSKIKFDDQDKCWNWGGSTDKFGYGWFSVVKNGCSKTVRTHRFLYETLFGEINNRKLQVLHTCDNAKCLNPTHHHLGTQRNNMDDKVSRNRQAVGSEIGTSKLTEDHVVLIKLRLSVGERKASIARSMNVSKTLIGYISKGLFWKHVQLKPA